MRNLLSPREIGIMFFVKHFFISSDEKFTSPYWLNSEGTLGMYKVEKQQLIGLPETPRSIKVKFNFLIENMPISIIKNVIRKYAESDKDYIHKLSVGQKEISETMYWLELLEKTNYLQIDEFKSEWDLGNVTNGSYIIPDEINTWSGNHPTLTSQLAPFVDLNQDDNYNPMDGDYPDIKGDQMLWWVYNDNTEHMSSGGRPLGIEIRVSFYGFFYANPPNDSIEAINNTTFLNFEIASSPKTVTFLSTNLLINSSTKEFSSIKLMLFFKIFSVFPPKVTFASLLGNGKR